MFVAYLFIRLITLPFAYLPYRALHALGRPLGTLAYFLFPSFRKRALSNLALASDLHLSNEEVRRIARQSIQSLMITLLEYPRLAREKEISKIATCENPENGAGAVFFVGHQANWELLFLEGTSRMPGVAIGRPIKNTYLYDYVVRMREKFGGKIVPPRNGIKEGLRALKEGKFMGIVGDQGMPDSGFSSPFLGREAYTSPMPALLAYKTRRPLIVATTRREKGRYIITYSKPLIPDPTIPKEIEVPRLMKEALKIFEESVKKRPEEWLWIHNRWKQQTLDAIRRPYRHDSIACIFPSDESLIEKIPRLRTVYPTESLTLFLPKALASKIELDANIHPYESESELLEPHYRYKCLFDFTKSKKASSHYKKWGAQTIAHPTTVEELETMVRNA